MTKKQLSCHRPFKGFYCHATVPLKVFVAGADATSGPPGHSDVPGLRHHRQTAQDGGGHCNQQSNHDTHNHRV
jgi:hypothetical protein